jgi:hypothetical protein
MKCRGQVSSIDLLAAVLIFTMIFFSLRGFWMDSMSKAINDSTNLEMQIKSTEALDVLLKTPGHPIDWNESTIELIGLAQKPGVLDEDKLNSFSLMDYSLAREKLGLGKYDFSFDINSVNPLFNKSIGKSSDLNTIVFSVNRTVVYKGGEASVIFKVFTN